MQLHIHIDVSCILYVDDRRIVIVFIGTQAKLLYRLTITIQLSFCSNCFMFAPVKMIY